MFDRGPETNFDGQGQAEEDDALHEHAEHVLANEVVRKSVRSNGLES